MSETYWGRTNATTIHNMASGTKSIGMLALAHAAHAGYFSTETNLTDYFPSLGVGPGAARTPLKLKHLLSMAGGAAASYHSPLAADWVAGLRQGPPGEVRTCTEAGLTRRPGSDFLYSFANPAIAQGLLEATTGSGFAEYHARHLFPVLGISPAEWRWLGDREGSSQPDGASFHTARNYAKLFYLMLRGGRWEFNGTVAQLLDPSWVAGAGKPTPADWGPCPVYSHFMWHKDLNYGNAGPRVPADTFYAYGGGGEFAVVTPSLDLVVVSLYGSKPVRFEPPTDLDQYKGQQYFPKAAETIVGGLCPGGFHGWGCWNFTYVGSEVDRAQPRRGGGQPGMPSVSCTAANTEPNDLLAGMMQRVVAAVKSGGAIHER